MRMGVWCWLFVIHSHMGRVQGGRTINTDDHTPSFSLASVLENRDFDKECLGTRYQGFLNILVMATVEAFLCVIIIPTLVTLLVLLSMCLLSVYILCPVIEH